MRISCFRKLSLPYLFTAFLMVLLLLSGNYLSVLADVSIPQTDQTPTSPLSIPSPATAWPRYISGFGQDNNYTIFYEDRNDSTGCSYGYRIYFNQTTTGPKGFSATSTATDICDTHLQVKNWPITISGYGSYLYRAWGSVDNDSYHTFYVSNNLVNWTRIYYGTDMFSDPSNIMNGETIDYGFHDIVKINGHYMGFVESAGGNTYIAWSEKGDENWTIEAKVGGSEADDLPLNLSFTSAGPIPTGNFLLMEVNGQLVYGKLMVPGNRQGAYLAINAAAAQASTPALAEAAFIDPANWTWSDGSTGLPGADNEVIASTLGDGGHDVREVWSPPTYSPRSDLVVLYTANYSSSTSGHGIGCAASSAECLVQKAISKAAVKSVSSTSQIPRTGFAPSKKTDLHGVDQKYDGLNLNLVIPSLQIDEEIVGVGKSDDTWDVSWLGNRVGYLEGTAFPTWDGNSVLTGHVYNSDGLPGIFNGLENLKWGDRVIIRMADQDYVYEVRQVRTVSAANNSFVFQHEDRSWLTLVTCKDYDESSDTYLYRSVVKAILIEIDSSK